MILVVTVETNRKKNTDIGDRLIQAEYWHAAQTVESTKTQFEYPLNYRDRRDSPTLLKTTDSILTIRTAANLAPTTDAIILSVRSDINDPASDLVNMDFRTRDIVWGKAFSASQSYVWIISGGFKVNQYLVNSTLAQIVALVTV